MGMCGFSLSRGVLFVYVIVFFMPVYPRSVSPYSFSSGTKFSKGKDELQEATTIRVVCHSAFLEIEADADLFELGFPVDVDDLTLGPNHPTEECKAVENEPGKYTIEASLPSCGTERKITEDYVIYSNTLEYSPSPSPDGLIRTQYASFPIQCYYKRRYDLNSIPVLPSWIPFISSKSDEGHLEFSLKVMTDNWGFERENKIYLLGDVINIEASVEQYAHLPMRVFIDKCVATLSADDQSAPKYAFIENNGCLVDGFLTGSNSHFLPRAQPDKLRLQLDAFKFYQEEQAELYITCTLRAELIEEMESRGKACSYIDKRWQSADREDWLCEACVCEGCGVGRDKAQPALSKQLSTVPRPAHSGSAPLKQRLTHTRPASRPATSLSSSKALSQFDRFKTRSRSMSKPSEASNMDTVTGYTKEKSVGPLKLKAQNNLVTLGAPKAVAVASYEPVKDRQFPSVTRIDPLTKVGPRGFSPVAEDEKLREVHQPTRTPSGPLKRPNLNITVKQWLESLPGEEVLRVLSKYFPPPHATSSTKIKSSVPQSLQELTPRTSTSEGDLSEDELLLEAIRQAFSE